MNVTYGTSVVEIQTRASGAAGESHSTQYVVVHGTVSDHSERLPDVSL